uniref:Uncharacterized protein n=1 Tax=Mucochytrium quahogii TaxID=96639 RepID=A0A7S2SI51_9STRA
MVKGFSWRRYSGLFRSHHFTTNEQLLFDNYHHQLTNTANSLFLIFIFGSVVVSGVFHTLLLLGPGPRPSVESGPFLYRQIPDHRYDHDGPLESRVKFQS